MADGDDVQHAPGERVPELSVLHRATRLVLDDARSRDARLQAIADLLPSALQHPTVATAAVRYGGRTFSCGAHVPTPWVLATTFHTRDGVRGELEVAYHEERPRRVHGPFLAEEHAFLATLGELLRGVLDRELATEALRVSNERLDLALDIAGIGFWDWDFRDNTVRWSRQLAAMAGREGELVGRFLEFSTLVHEDDLPTLRRWIERARAEDIKEGMELRLRRPDGSWRPLIGFTRRVRGPDGVPVRLVATLIDLTDRRALEAWLRQTQKGDALAQVAGGVAHDFNNLLSVILTGTEMLRSGLEPDHPLRGFVDDMYEATQTGASLSRQLLSFSRKASYQPSVVELGPLARRMEPILARLAGRRVAVRVDVERDAGEVWADPTQLDQVLINLVLNAREAMSGGGALTVEIATADEALVERARLPAGRYARLSVADRGPGIAADLVSRIFEPFFTTKETGTGLGLAVVSSVARQWSGSVVVDSALGAGATFHVLLPQLAA